MYSVCMFRMQIYMPEELFVHLKNRATIEDTSMSEVVRRSLRKILAIDNKKADPMKMFVGQAKMKEKTDAIKEISGYYQKKI